MDNQPAYEWVNDAIAAIKEMEQKNNPNAIVKTTRTTPTTSEEKKEITK
jgi:hypothetical protein